MKTPMYMANASKKSPSLIFKFAGLLLFATALGSCSDEIAIAVLERHNQYRTKHGVPALTLNAQLSVYAKEWAEHCAKTSSLSHRPGNHYGENLDFTYYPGVTDAEIAQNSVDLWYNEAQRYTYGTESVQFATLHFTQIVWKGSLELGVGIAKNSEGGIFMVCNYNPSGNIEFQFGNNVFEPMD
ncbi:Golgi-associated plant pathogenesis-related protein 1-like [Photinus pyralis]|uniref:Golgi-associated plant pathogenesis-related protein 1-like n=1 Tax=Photinus pyralis TaxID=7054 RepID=UPI00126712AB|nr:Golgi-associated plant pathogenesis-related protein 1-like [Photinus pyralis]